MKKISLLFAAVCVLFACNPTHEDISNGGHITVDELRAKTTVKTDKAADGKNGNVIICETLAPVNAVWEIGGKKFVSTSAKKKMKLGEHAVKLTALCADGTVLETEFLGIQCEEITDPLMRYYIYGEDPEKEPPFAVPPCRGKLPIKSTSVQTFPHIPKSRKDRLSGNVSREVLILYPYVRPLSLQRRVSILLSKPA